MTARPRPVPPRPARRRREVSAWKSRLSDDVGEELHDPRVALLAEPEDRLLAHFDVTILLCDVDELVDRAGIAGVRHHPDEVPLHVAVRDAIVEGHELAAGDARLAGGEERVLPDLLRLGLVE